MFLVSKKGTTRMYVPLWDYFVWTWMTMFLWNVNTYIYENEVDMQNRANNPVESYNRRGKQAFGSHPSPIVFIEKVKNEHEALPRATLRHLDAPPRCPATC